MSRIKKNAKLFIKVSSVKPSKELFTESVFDNRTGEYWTMEQIKERGILYFLNLDDLKESTNWNLNGDSRKYKFFWTQTGKRSTGIAFIFD